MIDATGPEWTEQRAMIEQHRFRDEPSYVHTNIDPELCRCAVVVSRPSTSQDGRTCSNCGGINFQNTGTCHTCMDCGHSDGCG